jgi:hypothetical protein
MTSVFAFEQRIHAAADAATALFVSRADGYDVRQSTRELHELLKRGRVLLATFQLEHHPFDVFVILVRLQEL